jgi:transitional endoplasmic reticulum ATPase
MHALRENKKAKEVKMKHFEKALEEVKPSLNERLIEFYKKFNERFKKKVMEEEKTEDKELGYVG